VHWKEFPLEEREWLGASELKNAPRVVADYHRKHPAKPRPMPTIRLRFQPLQNYTIPNPIPAHLFNWEEGTFERDLRFSRGTRLLRGGYCHEPDWLSI
jgi:hypothetical protein